MPTSKMLRSYPYFVGILSAISIATLMQLFAIVKKFVLSWNRRIDIYKRFYLPELELIMVDEADEVIGYVMFSRFHLEGRYEDELLILTPAAVKTSLQRQHISKELIEYGFEKAAALGYKAVIVEGNPMNYRSRGFVTSAPFGITAHESVGLPAPECLMVKELIPGGLDGIKGVVAYHDYDALR